MTVRDWEAPDPLMVSSIILLDGTMGGVTPGGEKKMGGTWRYITLHEYYEYHTNLP